MQESELYPVVARFLKTELRCVTVAKTTGPRYGSIDVVGLRYSKGRYGGSAELLAVEVKLRHAVFLKSLGQALGYSLMADRSYLAIHRPKGVTEPEAEMAAQLNVGLIQIRDRRHCSLVLSSPQHRPLRPHKLALMRKLGYVECVLCQAPVVREEAFRYFLGTRAGALNGNDRERRYVCEACRTASTAWRRA